MARKPETAWDHLNEAWRYYESHISSKADRFSLTVVDLLLVSNFKGGNASITEPLETLIGKLPVYEIALRAIHRRFRGRCISTITTAESQHLKRRCVNFLKLTESSKTKIRGFGASYASALLSAHFPRLIPVLDRRVINGAGIAASVDSQGQIKNIVRYYPRLIGIVRQLSQQRHLEVREVDRLLFITPLTTGSGRRLRLRRSRAEPGRLGVKKREYESNFFNGSSARFSCFGRAARSFLLHQRRAF